MQHYTQNVTNIEKQQTFAYCRGPGQLVRFGRTPKGETGRLVLASLLRVQYVNRHWVENSWWRKNRHRASTCLRGGAEDKVECCLQQGQSQDSAEPNAAGADWQGHNLSARLLLVSWQGHNPSATLLLVSWQGHNPSATLLLVSWHGGGEVTASSRRCLW